ncbi:lipoyl(octanoyl) transferase LipB [Chitinophagales bacterium]|nr:lipoyl(octanoyl) transferase LipB [Chitinophagales bacterium]
MMKEAKPNKQVVVQDWGLVPYAEAWDKQTEILDATVQRKRDNRELDMEDKVLTENVLVLCEHPHVYTLGKSGDAANLLINEQERAERGIDFFPINRGGDITYHGPGQIVGYPIIDLDNFFTDIHKYLRLLEQMIIDSLAHYGIEAGRLKGSTGVWLDPEDDSKARKICAMGIRCSRWVTMHGWAFNINTDMDYFKHIVPCGITDKAVTSLQQELGRPIDLEEVKQLLINNFSKLFEAEIIAAEKIVE